MAVRKRLTILADPETDTDVIKYFDGKGVTETGMKLLRVGIVLDEADLLDHLTMLLKKGIVENIGALESVKKSLEISALFNPEPEQKPPPESKKKSLTGFGSKK